MQVDSAPSGSCRRSYSCIAGGGALVGSHHLREGEPRRTTCDGAGIQVCQATRRYVRVFQPPYAVRIAAAVLLLLIAAAGHRCCRCCRRCWRSLLSLLARCLWQPLRCTLQTIRLASGRRGRHCFCVHRCCYWCRLRFRGCAAALLLRFAAYSLLQPRSFVCGLTLLVQGGFRGLCSCFRCSLGRRLRLFLPLSLFVVRLSLLLLRL
jgi:hypothetical protein